MKPNRLFCSVLCLILLFSLALEFSPTYAQGDGSPHAAIVATIPTLINFVEQADTTYVGEVDGSYAYIAFVIKDNFVVIYVCDSVGVSAWINSEVVDGLINASTDTGITIAATVTSEGVSGTITLSVDDDGTAPAAHNFATSQAVPGKTGLARFVDDSSVTGWIVTENGMRGLRKRRQEREHDEQCRQWQEEYSRAYARMDSYPYASADWTTWFMYAGSVSQLMGQNDCGLPS